jgi:hypothetical protein
MSAAPSEPEKYSIDEMMERLKAPAPENADNGELVTRADGSQAIRVRKRKRRSTQPHKDEAKRTKRFRIVQVTVALILLFLTILTVGGELVFVNSSPFRESLVEKISRTTGAEARLMTFRMNPKTANADGLDLTWPAGNVLDHLVLRGIVAQVYPASFLGKSFGGDEITVNEGTLALRVPEAQAPLGMAPSTAGPSPIHFKHIRIPAFHVNFGNAVTPAIRVIRSEASLSFKPATGEPQLRLYKGDLAIQGWPKLRLDRAFIEFESQKANVLQLRMIHETDDRGSLDLAGIVTPYRQDQDSKLAVTLNSFQLSGILGAPLGRLFSGRIDSKSAMDSNYLSFKPDASAPAVFETTFVASAESSVDLQGFPFLFALARDLDDEWFERPNFEGDAEGVIRSENGTVTLRNLNLESKGRLALRGTMVMDPAGNLSGTLQIGLTDAMISTSKEPHLVRLFGKTDGNYRWINVKINGTASNPGDNYKDLMAAVSQSGNVPARDSSPVPTFEDLTHPK